MHKHDSSSNVSDMESDFPMVDPNEAERAQITALELKLFSAARFFAEEEGFVFTPPCATIVRDLIRAGLNTMRRENRLAVADHEKAEDNLSRLVLAMADSARKSAALRGPFKPLFHDKAPLPKPLIREGDFVAAKRLCPIWPYC